MLLMAKDSITFDQWMLTVDRLCLAHLACSWNDLCGDLEPLRSAFDVGEDPIQFVRWWADKYDLALMAPLDLRKT